MENTGLVGIFLTGLITGGLTCMAVQGGLLAATIAQREEERFKEQIKQTGSALPILSFLVAKLVAYTMLGALLGLFGSAFQLSVTGQIIMQFAVVIFMIGTALNILNVHPIFRYFVIQPPRFITRIIRKKARSSSIFAPAMLGAFTVFIPCGTTQAMMALAIASGTPLYGAAILFAFVLGTSPVFFLLGYFATKLGDTLHQKFMRVAAYAIILLAVFNANNALALTGSPVTLETMWKGFYCTVSFCSNTPTVQATLPTDEATITIQSTGYNPQQITVSAGRRVTLHLKNTDSYSCAQSFTIPSLNVQRVVSVGTTDTITFDAPKEKGKIPFMCSMGMYRGVINVI
ncbi:MAG TPA: sulfite exporter TauE/SafE family protein [Patescibacteria group bacterium]|nr:sulfite exporter TauE/SafE family protein [Patescibacteria group bacterium]